MRHRASTFTIVSALAVVLSAAAAIGGEASAGIEGEERPAVLTREQMLAAVEKNRSRVEDISVSYSFKTTKGASGSEDHTKAVVKGDRVYFDKRYSLKGVIDPATSQPKIFTRQVAYNGEVYTYHEVDDKIAAFAPDYARELRAANMGFFNIAMYDPPREDYHGLKPVGLVAALSSQECRVKPMQENIDGRWCHVVEVIDRFSGKATVTVWIDPERGFLPVMQRRGNIEMVIDEAVEVEEGLWFPVSGIKRNFARTPPGGQARLPESFATGEQVLKVDRLEDGTWAIEVNTGVEDEFFDLWKRVPDGTKVVDMKVNVEWIAGEGPSAAVADEFELMLTDEVDLAVEPATTPEPQEVAAETPASSDAADTPAQSAPAEAAGHNKTGLVVLIAVLAVAALTGAVALVRRRSKPKGN